MREAHGVADVRAAERALMATLPPGTLMRRAATGLAAVCARVVDGTYGARVVVLAGSGDNGGDALYAGAALAGRGAAVTAVAAGSRLHDGGSRELRAAGGAILDATEVDATDRVGQLLARSDLVVDGLVGIGGAGGLRERHAALADAAAAAPGTVVAVDLPSGVDADTGVVAGSAVRADVTVTFGTWKPGLLVDPGAGCAGVAELVDIGLRPYLGPAAVVAPGHADVADLLRRPTAESDKYRRGVVGVVAGSDRFVGAAMLAVGAAVHGGAGMVRLLSAGPVAAAVRQRWPEVVITVTPDEPGRGGGDVLAAAGRVQTWAAGPGMGTDDDAAALLRAVLASDVPVLVDADGLTVLAARRDLLPRTAPTLLTPHAGELARLLAVDRADVEARRLHHARAAARELGVTVLLKGSTTVVATPGGRVAVNPTGTPWLATAGTGDVLAGLAGALLAQGLDPADAGIAAAYLHGLAARFAADGAAPIAASDVLHALPEAFRAVAAWR